MTKFKFNKQFRGHLSEKLMELGNLVAIALVFGQFVNGSDILITTLISGFLISIFCYILSFLIDSK